jgi:hypothetical protein
MSIQDLAYIVGLLFTLAGIVFYGGRITQKIDDLAKRFDEAGLPQLDKRITRIEAQIDVCKAK